MFESVIVNGVLTIQSIMICLGVSLVLGLILSTVYLLSGKYSKSFAITLALLPAIVQVVITMVNGNLGTGIAVLGAFSLVRFRSVPGTSMEICYIFFAMAVGLATGMGYVAFAAVISVVLCAMMFILSRTKFAENDSEKSLIIVIPENLDYSDIFDDLFDKYTKRAKLDRVKTTNLGSLFELKYNIQIKDPKAEKTFIDELRCRNGNLTVMLSQEKRIAEEL